MKAPIKIGVYAVGLVAIFAAALGVGRVATPDTPVETSATHAGDPHGEDDGSTEAARPPAGLQIAQDGYRLTALTPSLAVNAPTTFRFQVLDRDGSPVTSYTPTHDKFLHLVVVRRDLSGFQHVHPTMAADGTWSIPLSVAGAGQYRVFADFQPVGRAQPLTLGVDVPAPGDYRPVALPPASQTATLNDYTVTLAGRLVPGTTSRLALTITEGGAPVTDLQPYLGAYGHLVALRAGDLAYLHVHPGDTAGHAAGGPQLVFYAEVPAAGTYRLFLDFQHAGAVHTVAFTANATDKEQ